MRVSSNDGSRESVVAKSAIPRRRVPPCLGAAARTVSVANMEAAESDIPAATARPMNSRRESRPHSSCRLVRFGSLLMVCPLWSCVVCRMASRSGKEISGSTSCEPGRAAPCSGSTIHPCHPKRGDCSRSMGRQVIPDHHIRHLSHSVLCRRGRPDRDAGRHDRGARRSVGGRQHRQPGTMPPRDGRILAGVNRAASVLRRDSSRGIGCGMVKSLAELRASRHPAAGNAGRCLSVIGGLGLVPDPMRERLLHDRVRRMGWLVR